MSHFPLHLITQANYGQTAGPGGENPCWLVYFVFIDSLIFIQGRDFFSFYVSNSPQK